MLSPSSQLLQQGTTGSSPRQNRMVDSVQELLAVLSEPNVEEIIVKGDLYDVPAFRLQPGQALRGAAELRTPPVIRFAEASDGVELTTDNHLAFLQIVVQPRQLAIHNAPDSPTLGRIFLQDITTIGRVRIVVAAHTGKAHLEVRSLCIEAADTGASLERPTGYGVAVLQGAFTLWNQRPASAGVMTADLLDVAVGRLDAPVLGSGIFVCGAGHQDISLHVQRLRTREVYNNGCIPPGTPDQISGGVFVVYGAFVDAVENVGPVTTFGPNDMALDNWGRVDSWTAREKVTTFGPSAIGFVNFGTILHLLVRAGIETHGTGARGFNVYSGMIGHASFDRIETRGDGAVAVQIGQPIGTLNVQRGIRTHGGTGKSLVKGVVQELSAIGLSLRPGGSVQQIHIKGGLFTSGSEIPALEQAGEVGRLLIEGGFGSIVSQQERHGSQTNEFSTQERGQGS